MSRADAPAELVSDHVMLGARRRWLSWVIMAALAAGLIGGGSATGVVFNPCTGFAPFSSAESSGAGFTYRVPANWEGTPFDPTPDVLAARAGAGFSYSGPSHMVYYPPDGTLDIDAYPSQPGQSATQALVQIGNQTGSQPTAGLKVAGVHSCSIAGADAAYATSPAVAGDEPPGGPKVLYGGVQYVVIHDGLELYMAGSYSSNSAYGDIKSLLGSLHWEPYSVGMATLTGTHSATFRGIVPDRKCGSNPMSDISWVSSDGYKIDISPKGVVRTDGVYSISSAYELNGPPGALEVGVAPPSASGTSDTWFGVSGRLTVSQHGHLGILDAALQSPVTPGDPSSESVHATFICL